MGALALATPAFAENTLSTAENTNEPESIHAILVGDTDFDFSIGSNVQLSSLDKANTDTRSIRIEKYITVQDILEDGTAVLNMSNVAPVYETYLPIQLTLTQLSKIGNVYLYSVDLEIALTGSGNAVKSFSATLDYGDGSTAFNSISYDSLEANFVQLSFPDKYYNAGSYKVKITNYNLVISSGRRLCESRHHSGWFLPHDIIWNVVVPWRGHMMPL